MFAMVLALCAVSITSGCAALAQKVGPQLADGVNQYCEKLTADERQVVHDAVNAQTAPNAIDVQCARDEGDGS